MSAHVTEVREQDNGQTYGCLVADSLTELFVLAEEQGIPSHEFVQTTTRPHYRVTGEERARLISGGHAHGVGYVYGCRDNVS